MPGVFSSSLFAVILKSDGELLTWACFAPSAIAN